MANKNKSLFSSLTSEVATAEPNEEIKRERKSSLLVERSNNLSNITSGDVVEKTQMWIDPDKCRMWERHNRRYDLLNEYRCEDLIEGFKSQGQQEFPAVVRRIHDDVNYDYEVICGARRHWTVTWLRNNNYPQYKFLIEVRTLTNEEAFRLSDIENRDKEDISEWERALDYKDALSLYYNTQKQMAERLEVSEAWLSRFLDLASLPAEVVSAYPDITQIRLRHGMELKSLLKDRVARQKVLAEAKRLKNKIVEDKEQGRAMMDGAQVVNALKIVARAKAKSNNGPLAQYQSKAGKVIMSVTKKGKGGLVFNIDTGSGATKTELIKAATQAIREHYE